MLFLFGIMLTRAPMHPRTTLDNDLRWPARSSSRSFLVGVLGYAARSTRSHADKLDPSDRRSRTARRSRNSIFRTYLIPFEVVSRAPARPR